MKKKIIGTIAALALFLGVWFAWGIYSYDTTARPEYEVVKIFEGDIELREYGGQTLITVEDGNGFGTLAGYIFGDNETGEKIAMTAPVITKASERGGIAMSFILPSGLTSKNAPKPNTDNIEITDTSNKRYIVARFGGYTTMEKVRTAQISLLNTVEKEGLDQVSAPMLWQYNDPWTPAQLRRNEVAIEIK